LKKRISAFLCVLFAVVFPSLNVYASGLNVSAQSAVLMCAETGEVLYSVNPDEKLSMASTTKIMTSLIALEAAVPEMEITVTDEMVSVEGTSMGLLPGDSVSLKELVYGMLIQSGNDAANTVAHVLGGTTEGFAAMMNSRAEEIGMKNTNFVTASGLDDKEHYSTAYDMALLAVECIKNPEFRAICSLKSARLTYGNPPYSRTLTNHNRLLWSYEGAIGVKTGFTKKSGRCLVSAAERDGITLVAVTLNAPSDWSDHRKMLDFGFSVCESEKIDFDYSFCSCRVYGGVPANVSLRPAIGLSLPKRENEYAFIPLINPYLFAPVNEGTVAGKLLVLYGNEVVETVLLETAGSVSVREISEVAPKNEEKKGIFSELFDKIKDFLFRGEH